jgi:hypothetical protein
LDAKGGSDVVLLDGKAAAAGSEPFDAPSALLPLSSLDGGRENGTGVNTENPAPPFPPAGVDGIIMGDANRPAGGSFFVADAAAPPDDDEVASTMLPSAETYLRPRVPFPENRDALPEGVSNAGVDACDDATDDDVEEAAEDDDDDDSDGVAGALLLLVVLLLVSGLLDWICGVDGWEEDGVEAVEDFFLAGGGKLLSFAFLASSSLPYLNAITK